QIIEEKLPAVTFAQADDAFGDKCIGNDPAALGNTRRNERGVQLSHIAFHRRAAICAIGRRVLPPHYRLCTLQYSYDQESIRPHGTEHFASGLWSGRDWVSEDPARAGGAGDEPSAGSRRERDRYSREL